MLSSHNFTENCKTGSNTKLNQREDTINLTANEKPYSCNNRAISVFKTRKKCDSNMRN